MTYSTVHNRLARTRGPASKHRCAACPGAAETWAYDRSDPDERHGHSGGYPVVFSTDLARYIPLCGSCHWLLDHRGVWLPIEEFPIDGAELADLDLVRTGAVLAWRGR